LQEIVSKTQADLSNDQKSIGMISQQIQELGGRVKELREALDRLSIPTAPLPSAIVTTKEPAQVIKTDIATPPAPPEASMDRQTWRKVQRALALSKIDGRKGARTIEAIKRYQQKHGEPVTGNLTAVDKDVLLRLVH
jgi:peptidoglycan hydrolase-like protein with peptidoglycan-binding domain